MDLETYLRGRKQSGVKNPAKELAEAVGVTSHAVRQWLAGARPVPPKKAVLIERATKCQVTRGDLRKDWRELWPELAASAANDEGAQRAQG